VEEYVYVLDYLPEGRADVSSHHRYPVVYGLGDNQFTLLELVPKNNVTLSIGDRIYVGKNPKKREKIKKIKGRIPFDDLTSTAHGELPYVLIDVVKQKENYFIQFFNNAPAISTRFHVLELLPGLGKKMMHDILTERRKQKFTGFKDMVDRIDFLRDPAKLVAKRIELELSDPNQKYRLFTRPPANQNKR
jgi:putative nucleotide binding protein